MDEKDPTSYPLFTYAWVVGLAIWGGVVRHYQQLQRTKKPFKLGMFLGEVASSGLAGLLAFFFCEWSDVPELLAAILIAISGHTGAETLLFFRENVHRRYMGSKARSVDHSHNGKF